jgi:predicted transcriptional regulator
MVATKEHPNATDSILGTAKVSVSLSRELLERVDHECATTGESRSQLFRRALDALFEGERRDAEVRRYLDGYVAEPEAEYEVAAAGASARPALESEGWD